MAWVKVRTESTATSGNHSLTVLRVYLPKSYPAIGSRSVGRSVRRSVDSSPRRRQEPVVDTADGGERLAEGRWMVGGGSY